VGTTGGNAAHILGCRGLASAAALILLSVACGTRLSEQQVQAQLAGQPAAGQGGLQGTGPSGAGGGPHVKGSQGGSVAVGKGGAKTKVPKGSSVLTPGSGRGSGPCATNPGSTDVGVSRDSIAVGASYAESSLVPGQFRPAIDGVQSYFNLVNQQGGVCGRHIAFHFYNDGLNAQAYSANVRKLVETDKVFAVVGSLSAADSGGCSYMAGQKPPDGAPDIGTFALSYCRAQAANFYSPVGSLKPNIYGCCAEWQFLKARSGLSKPAVHYLDIEISKDEGLAVVDALVRTLGLSDRSDVYQGEHSPAQFDYTGDVVNMKSAGVDGVWSSMDLNNDVKLVRAICQQGWHPKVIHLEISAYDPSFISRVGASCLNSQNVWIRSVHLPFNQPNQEMSLYLSTLKRYCPSCQPTTFGLEGWLTAKMFVEALRGVGPDLTRPKLYQWLAELANWTGGGVMGPVTPAKRLIYNCNYMLNVRSNGFFRESGLLCGKFYASGNYSGAPVGP
jgi:branched-chain amino acid transport system substrate-binding protein